MSFVRPLGVLFVLLGFLMGGTTAFAQAAHDTHVLSEAERTHYRDLLSRSNDSAERAKVKSEMNRLIQTRQIERRKAADSAPTQLDQNANKTDYTH